MVWQYDLLWAKAVLYAERAAAEEREGQLFPLWSAMALEFVARAALASIHPALLADPQEGQNLLYAFGYGTATNPKSIPFRTVLRRCVVVVEEFTEDDARIAVTLSERRNAEFHSGALPFVELPTHLWLPDYYRLIAKLVEAQGKTLEDLFGDEADSARVMIEGAEAAVIGEVQRRLAAARLGFDPLTDDEIVRRRREALGALRGFDPGSRTVECPACESHAWSTGEIVRVGEARLEDDEILQENVVLPTRLECDVCGLVLRGYEEMHAAELGGQYAVVERSDPADVYGSAFDPADYYDDDDYGND